MYNRKILFAPVITAVLVALLTGCSRPSIEEKRGTESLGHFSKSIDYDNKATAIINKGGPYSTIDRKDSDKMIEFYEKALVEARQVNIEFLNSKYSEWGTRYNDHYIKGMELIIKGHREVNASASLKGQELVAMWKYWFGENVKAIKSKGIQKWK
jgi:hypothetical protein